MVSVTQGRMRLAIVQRLFARALWDAKTYGKHTGTLGHELLFTFISHSHNRRCFSQTCSSKSREGKDMAIKGEAFLK